MADLLIVFIEENQRLINGTAFLIVLALLSGLIFISMQGGSDKPNAITRLRDALGMTPLHPVILLVTVFLWTAIALILVSGLFGLILDLLNDIAPERPIPGDTEEAQKLKDDAVWQFRFKLIHLTALTTVLGAVIALPFTLVRLGLTQEQTKTARDALFNEKINAATQGLYARRQVTKRKRKDGFQHIWQDDIVQRAAAIDRLEGLADENRNDVPRIARLLSVYVRELSDEVPAIAPPGDATPTELRDWANKLPKLRSDMEKAAQTLGRLNTLAETPLANGEIDLRGANVQNADLKNLDFGKALLSETQLQGANLGGAELQGATLGGAQFDASTSLTDAALRGASVKEVDFTSVPQILPHLDDIYGDASVTLPDGIAPGHDDWPPHWSEEKLSGLDFYAKWKEWQATLPEGWDKDIPMDEASPKVTLRS